MGSILHILASGSAVAGLILAAPAMAQSTGAQPSATPPSSVVSQADKIPPKIDSRVFAQRPNLNSAKLSPDGMRIAYLGRNGDQATIVYRDLTVADATAISIPQDYELNWFRWAGPNKLIVSLGYGAESKGDTERRTVLLSYDLLTRKSVFVGRRTQGLDGDDVIYVDPAGEFALLSIQGSIYEYPGVFRANLTSGALSQVQRPMDSVWLWVADNAGTVRLGIGYVGRSIAYYYRKNEKDAFKKVASFRFDESSDESNLGDYALTVGSDEGYVLSSKTQGRYSLHKFNFATRQLGELVFSAPLNDVQSIGMNQKGDAPLFAEYTDDVVRTKWFDPTWAQDQADIDKALGRRTGEILSWSRDGSIMLVSVAASNNPGSLYIYIPQEGKMTRIGQRIEGLNLAQLPVAKPITYAARDGLQITGYLTLPLGRNPKNLPLVIMPHGGPFGVRDTLTFDPEVQFLANRGYVVLQPNYRGSGGFGQAFDEAGKGQYGRKMQDDLDDGMDWLVKQGIVDKDRVCLVGSSYGGYAALWGVTRNPERYRCGASFAGVSDLKRQIKYDRGFLYGKNRDRWRTTVTGDDATFDLDTVSALPQVSRLTRPVLLAHGEKDMRVQFKQSKLYAEALAKAGKEHEFYSYKTEGHGFTNADNMKHWLDKLEAFLTKYNPA